jgi:hypothetical protein
MAMSCSINATSDSALNLAQASWPVHKICAHLADANSSTTCVFMRLDDSTRSLRALSAHGP